jgi:hypothetical protein
MRMGLTFLHKSLKYYFQPQLLTLYSLKQPTLSLPEFQRLQGGGFRTSQLGRESWENQVF